MDKRRPARWRPTEPSRVQRWECRCQDPPVLLGTYDPNGLIHIKAGDRYWHVSNGQVRAICPRCGTEHVLNLSNPRIVR